MATPVAAGPGSSGLPRQLALGHLHSARSALLTVVSAYVYPRPVPVPTGTFVRALDLLGFNETAARQALNRARAAGWLRSQRSGRRSRWEISPAGLRVMDQGTARLNALRDGNRDWDGHLLFLNVSVPESARQLRHLARTRLAWLGFTTIAPGLWVSTNTGAEEAAGEVLSRLGLDGYSYTGRAGTIGDLNETVRSAWDLGGLAREYADFVAQVEALRPQTDDEYLVAMARMIHRWRRFPFTDPGLPDALLPRPWIGRRASQLTKTMGDLWRGVAYRRWDELVTEAER